LEGEDSLTWSLEEVEELLQEPKDGLPDEDLDQPVNSASEEEREEKVQAEQSTFKHFRAPFQDLRQLVDTYITRTLQWT
jgi:hypothetical protein